MTLPSTLHRSQLCNAQKLIIFYQSCSLVNLVEQLRKPLAVLSRNVIRLLIASVPAIKFLVKVRLNTGEASVSLYERLCQHSFATWVRPFHSSLLRSPW
jgi:predicted acyltransferase